MYEQTLKNIDAHIFREEASAWGDLIDIELLPKFGYDSRPLKRLLRYSDGTLELASWQSTPRLASDYYLFN